MSDSKPIDYSRCPLWWFSVVIVWCDSAVQLRDDRERRYRTHVRAADYEAARIKAGRIADDVVGRPYSLMVNVAPLFDRAATSRRVHAFAGYADE